jgi:hypothetical protein
MRKLSERRRSAADDKSLHLPTVTKVMKKIEMAKLFHYLYSKNVPPDVQSVEQQHPV